MAVKVYTRYGEFNEEKILEDNDAFFDAFVSVRNLGEIEEKVMVDIDGARILDRNIGTIITPLGATVLERLSTGCKTVLNYLYLLTEKGKIHGMEAIDVSYCGANALEVLFKIIEGSSTEQLPILLSHKDMVSRCSRREYIVNDERIIENLNFM